MSLARYLLYCAAKLALSLTSSTVCVAVVGVVRAHRFVRRLSTCGCLQNFRGFDIANHFNEWAGGTDTGEPDYSKFPTAEQQERFCAAYLTEMQGSADGTAELVEEASKFVLADHWYWGLWAVNQARDEGCDDFAYLTYAQRRIGEYYKIVGKGNGS
eukprot:COSAG06_NODE_6121_length_3099_cov_1.673000_2_plen_157_part_00